MNFKIAIAAFVFLAASLFQAEFATAQNEGSPAEGAAEYEASLGLIRRGMYSLAAPKFEALINKVDDAAIVNRARFLAGYCRYMAGNYAQAEPHLRAYIEADGLLKDYARYYRALSLSFTNEHHKAISAWRIFLKNYPDSRWDREARLMYAESYLKAAKPDKALEILRPLLKKTKPRDQRARILLLIGNCQEARRAYGDAKKTYRSIYIWHPASGSAPKAARRLRALKVDPDEMTPEERWSRAEELYKRARWEAALAEFAALLGDKRFNKTDERGRKALIRKAMCLYRLYRTDEALAAFQGVIDMPRGAFTSTAYYYAGHCYGRKEMTEKSVAMYRKVIEETPKSSLVPNAYINIAQAMCERGLWEEAIADYEAVRRGYRRSARKHDIPWKIGWIYYRRGDYEKARKAFMGHPGGWELGDRRNAYWAARALDQSGKKAVARIEYARVGSERRNDYYGALAAGRLGLPLISGVKPATPEAKIVDTSGVKSRRLDRARELAFMALAEHAVEELAQLEKQKELSRDDHLAISLMYRQYGDYYRSRRAVYRYMGVDTANYKPENDRYWRLMYPRAYRAEVESAAEKHGLDPNLVWSIMMQESNFKPRVTSAAGARGLMQIIPPTAGDIARWMDIRNFNEATLYQPAVNIEFGAYYLARVAKGFNGHPATWRLAVASYNGGPMNAKRWMRARPNLEVDEWVEEIPFNETRNYLKKVFGNWATYQMLYGKNSEKGLPVPPGHVMMAKQPAQPKP